MKDIRKGNDIFITWVIRNVPSADDLAVVLYGPGNKLCTLTDGTGTYNSETHNYVYTATYQGIDQTDLGIYRMELHRNYGEADQNILDKVHAFRLWGPVNWGIMRGNDPDNLTTATVNLESEYSATTNAGLDPSDYYTRGEVDALLDDKENALNYYSEDTQSESASIECGNASIDVEAVDGGTIALEATHTSIEDGDGNGILVGVGGTSGVSVETSGTYKFTYNGEEVATKNEIPSPITVDNALSTTSTNPVQNKVITAALDDKYEAPSGGIPATDMTLAVQTALAKADGAIQDAPINNKQYGRKNGAWFEVAIPIDGAPVQGSPNAVSSGGVYSAMQGLGNMTISAQSGTELAAAMNTYYVYSSAVSTLAITLPSISSATSVSGFVVSLTTGSSISLTVTASGGEPIKMYSGLSIAASKEYELNFLWNGSEWIVAYGEVVAWGS